MNLLAIEPQLATSTIERGSKEEIDTQEFKGPRISSIALSATTSFGNFTSHDITIYHLDDNGKRLHHGSVRPGELLRLQTHIGHPWVVTGPDDAALAVYMPEPGTSLALVR